MASILRLGSYNDYLYLLVDLQHTKYDNGSFIILISLIYKIYKIHPSSAFGAAGYILDKSTPHHNGLKSH